MFIVKVITVITPVSLISFLQQQQQQQQPFQVFFFSIHDQWTFKFSVAVNANTISHNTRSQMAFLK